MIVVVAERDVPGRLQVRAGIDILVALLPVGVGGIDHPVGIEVVPDRQDEPAVQLRRRPVHGHGHHGGVVEVGIIGVVVLERPAAGANIWLLVSPVAFDIQHLQGL